MFRHCKQMAAYLVMMKLRNALMLKYLQALTLDSKIIPCIYQYDS